MSLKARLEEDMKAALRAREEGKERLGVIRMVRSAIRNQEIDKGQELDDDAVAAVIAKELKQRHESLEEFRRAGREETAAQLEREIAVLKSYLPEQLEEAQLVPLIREAIQQTGAQGPKEMGKVMGVLMPKVKGKADGRLVNELVRRELGA